MLNQLKQFMTGEDGAITVDWVVLTAAIVGLGLVVMTRVSGGVGNASASIVTTLGTLQTVFNW